MIADRYELDRAIGRGGMGTVWLGRDVVLGRAVAVKQLGLVPGGESSDLDRAEREARLGASLNHAHVVAVFDLVDDQGWQWLVMEHVDGRSLADLIAERGPLAAAEIAPILRQVASALVTAHQQGIVHRDVKPSNILLTLDGVAKLSDFGVARAQADASLTATGLVTGSPAYLAPEVATGRPATAASDVWSLGATIFHALAGRAPYATDGDLIGTMYRIVHEEPPRLDPDQPLAPLVTAMMQQQPQARPTMSAIEHAAATPDAVRLDESVELDLESTQGFTAFGDLPGSSTVSAAPSVLPTVAQSAVPQSAAGPRRRWVALGAGVIAAAVVAVVIVIGRGSGTDTPSTPTAATETTRTAGNLEGFAADYLTAASNDPREGFAMLTPAYQRASGGIEGYRGFWDKVSNLDVQTVHGDPANLTVAYTYSYDLRGARKTEDVTLQLVTSGSTFRIAGDR